MGINDVLMIIQTICCAASLIVSLKTLNAVNRISGKNKSKQIAIGKENTQKINNTTKIDEKG